MYAHNKTSSNASQSPFPVIGIAMDSNESENLITLISRLSENSGMAFIIYQSLVSEQSNNFAGLLRLHTVIPVVAIVSSINIVPDHIYIIPPGNLVVHQNETLQLTPALRSTKVTNCLDLYFDALSQQFGSYVIGVLLSWFAADGISGLKNIKDAGGATVSAIESTGLFTKKSIAETIDYFTTPELAASILLEIKNSYQETKAYDETTEPAANGDIIESIVNQVVVRTGTNFHQYNKQTLRRSIAKRMVLTKQESSERYLQLLKNKPSEQDLLFHDLLIPVTYFFRDSSFFESLSKIVFPKLIETMSGNELRIWSAGCATGEEAYSLAICIDEFLNKTNNHNIAVKIFASDLSENCIEKARNGSYSLQDLKGIDERRIATYFTKRDSRYHVNKIIRDNCVFAVHDLTKDFPFSNIDFISCRNVLIYFNSDLQQQALSCFHYSLRAKGFLFLGTSESVDTTQNLFTAVENGDNIYVRSDTKPGFMSGFDIGVPTFGAASGLQLSEIKTDFAKLTRQILYEQHSPAAVLIGDDLEILHFQGDTSFFLQPQSGTPSFNIIHMARQELRLTLHNAILEAKSQKKNIHSVTAVLKNQLFSIVSEIIYLPLHPELLVIIFTKHPIGNTASKDLVPNHFTQSQLTLQNDYRHISEEQQIYFEELQTTNEELFRRAEELQLLNEKLESAAEELRSNNEELSCINDELRNRRNELFHIRNFYESIVKTIKEPLLIIDKDFIVHNANPAFYSYFGEIEDQTQGYSVFDLGRQSWNTPEFKQTVLQKINRHEPVVNVKIQFVSNGRNKRTMLVKADSIQGSLPEGMLLITFEDITETEQSNELLQAKNDLLENYSQQLEAFTTAASHNLLDPVNKIHMFAKKIIDAENDLTENAKYNIIRLLGTVDNLSIILQDLFSYSKINFSEKVYKKSDLTQLVRKATTNLKAAIQKRNGDIVVDPLPSMKIIPAQMQLLFTHLISNAIENSRPDVSPKVKIGANIAEPDELADRIDAGASYIRLTISDNGTGFPKEYEKRIFEPFYKLHKTEGQFTTGLGLTLVQKIAANHKGFVKASSNPGEGTTICVYIPLEIEFAEQYSSN